MVLDPELSEEESSKSKSSKSWACAEEGAWAGEGAGAGLRTTDSEWGWSVEFVVWEFWGLGQKVGGIEE